MTWTDDPRYGRGMALFNERKYFEAHDIWEEMWRETRGREKNFLQGLIQVASAFHQWRNQNIRGARLLYDSSLPLLKSYGDVYGGVDLARLKELFENALGAVAEAPWEDLPGRTHKGGRDFPFDDTTLFMMPTTASTHD